MARLNTRAQSSDLESEPHSASSASRRRAPSETPPSPALSFSSDKENHNTSDTSGGQKRKSASRTMSTPSAPDSTSSNKRRKLGDKTRMGPSQVARRREIDNRVDKQFYDPDQNEDERRATKKGLRSLYSRLNDSRADYLQPQSRGLEETLREADELYKNVKQTADATIDSRILVTTADLSYRKINSLTLGDSSTGVDIDDFITKAISFMRGGSHREDDVPGNDHAAGRSSTGTQRRHRQQVEAEDGEEGDTLNWAYLGSNACFLYNKRPCVTGFLLGPLSVQKKIRQPTQRRAREARADPSQAVRPIVLGEDDLEKQETANLTVICSRIAQLLSAAQSMGRKKLEEEYEAMDDEPSVEEMQIMMRRHGISDNECVPLFDFCVNPRSFGQTVENMFYVSFLIKEGKVGLDFDSRGLPTLGIAEEKTVAERQETPRNQAVFTLDFDIWQQIVESYGIEKSIIPHRKDEDYDDGTRMRPQEFEANEGGLVGVD